MNASPKPWYRLSLTTWIMIGLVAGGVLGWAKPEWGVAVFFLRDIFLNLIKSIIAPLIFSSIVVGIAGGGDLRKVGRMGLKALVYFELATTVALFLGLGLVNLTQPGAGVSLPSGGTSLGQVAQHHPLTLIETIVHIFPASLIDAMARGDVLQIVAFSVVFALALAAIGEKGKPVLLFCESLSQVMFKFTGYVMLLAPVGVGAAMAHTVGEKGLGVLLNLGMLVGTLYASLIIFVVLILGAVAAIIRLPVGKFVKAVREPFLIAFATTSSESALPKAMENMERLGVPKRIVGFVLPTGYSFNLDGSTLYLAMASVFIAQAAETTTGVHFGFGQQLLMMITLMITTKGIAAVPRASLVILLATVSSFGLPPEGVALLFGVDELCDMARTSVNIVGNCMATTVVARWEGEFDDRRASVFGTPEEVSLDLAEGEPAFADSAKHND